MATPPSQAEQDRQLLQNRINRLLIEQEKASKRIAETVRRTEEIKRLKMRNQATTEARKDATAWIESEQQLQKELLDTPRMDVKHTKHSRPFRVSHAEYPVLPRRGHRLPRLDA